MSKLSGWNIVCIAVAGAVLSLSVANAVRADCFSDQVAKLDIVGVHLGMTPAEAKSVLSQHRKGMRWLEGQEAALWSNAADNGAERVDVAFSPPPGGPKVMAVLRHVEFDKSHAPTVEGLASSLTEKFGQPTQKSQSFNFQELFWGWDKSGQSPMGMAGGCSPLTVSNFGKWGAASMYFIPVLQKENDDGCALAVEARIGFNSSGGIADQLDMALVDTHDALQAAIANDTHVKQVEQVKKEEELKKASANKPAL